MKKEFDFSVGSDVDYENLIADIGYDNQLVAILTQEEGFHNVKIQFFPPKEGNYWNFSLHEFEEILHRARNRLWELRRIDDDKES